MFDKFIESFAGIWKDILTSLTNLSGFDIFILGSTIGLWLFASYIVLVKQNRHSSDIVRNYTRAEYFLIKNDKVDVKGLISYHTAINWANYAALAFTALVLILTLEDGISEDAYLKNICLTLLLISAILMALADRVFTNNLSPFVPLDTRFRITNLCVKVGGTAFFVNLLALALFFSTFQPIFAPVVIIILLIGTVMSGRARGIPMIDLVEAYNLTSTEKHELKALLEAKENPWSWELSRKMREADKEDIAPVFTEPVERIFFDIDDTITTDGQLPAKSYAALELLRDKGITMIAVTGRPAGWCDMIARFWPVDAVVGENGAVYFRYIENKKVMKRIYSDGVDPDKARQNNAKLSQKVLKKFPGAKISKDQPYRDVDLAVDFAEDIDPPLSRETVNEIKAFLESNGLTAKVSSIHVNAWEGQHNKLSMVEKLMQDEFKLTIDDIKDTSIYVGDSPNDEPMFEYFPRSVGVQNIMDFWDELQHKPSLVMRGRGADGFVELAQIVTNTKDEK